MHNTGKSVDSSARIHWKYVDYNKNIKQCGLNKSLFNQLQHTYHNITNSFINTDNQQSIMDTIFNRVVAHNLTFTVILIPSLDVTIFRADVLLSAARIPVWTIPLRCRFMSAVVRLYFLTEFERWPVVSQISCSSTLFSYIHEAADARSEWLVRWPLNPALSQIDFTTVESLLTPRGCLAYHTEDCGFSNGRKYNSLGRFCVGQWEIYFKYISTIHRLGSARFS